MCPKKDRVLDTVISSTAGYFVGKISKDKFIATTKFLPLDYGFDFYAPQVLKAPDGRYLLWGWMSNMSAAEEKLVQQLILDISIASQFLEKLRSKRVSSYKGHFVKF